MPAIEMPAIEMSAIESVKLEGTRVSPATIRRRLARIVEDGTSAELARAAELRWVDDSAPGISRRRCGRGFCYRMPDGEVVRDPELKQRIRDLVIPPAWTNVWICRDRRGHLQATGIDDAGRKQYLYHERWAMVRDAKKFSRLVPFGEALPRLRRRIRRDLKRPTLDRRRVLATAVRLLDTARLRVGNHRYAEANQSFGLTTLEPDHVEVKRDELRLHFVGKSGKELETICDDPRIVQVVRECLEIPGCTLFHYLDDDDEAQGIDSGDVNAYVSTSMDGPFTAKDFRTWSGTVLTVEELLDFEAGSERPEKEIVAAIKAVAAALGNTPSTCREYYVHPLVLDAYQDGRLHALAASEPTPAAELRRSERLTLDLLRAEAAK